MKSKISLINLGCPKNLVDSEIILGILKNSGFEICDDVIKAQILLINTCAFIEEAKQESIDLILQLARIKEEPPKKYLVVIGCLVQRYLSELTKEIPEVDLWVKLSEIPHITELINNLIAKKPNRRNNNSRPIASHFLYDHTMPRYKITPSHYAYVKIAEGCSHYCSYCVIPNIKGIYRSRPMESIFKEVRELVNQGTKEIILIAQDTTSYGMDIPGRPSLAQLLKRLCVIDKLKWLRILYTHPAYITEEFINEIADEPKICKYIDIPLQHIDNELLHKMNRRTNTAYIKNLIGTIRSHIPNAVLRTSFIVGFPGETEEKFEKLLAFMKDIKFQRLGIFIYSAEEGTPAYNMQGQISEDIKKQRFHTAMELQQKISMDVNKGFMNKKLDVIVEGKAEGNRGLWYGRSYADAPDVDGLVYISKNRNHIHQGDMIRVKITNTMEYDLEGEIVHTKTYNQPKTQITTE